MGRGMGVGCRMRSRIDGPESWDASFVRCRPSIDHKSLKVIIGEQKGVGLWCEWIEIDDMSSIEVAGEENVEDV